MWTSDQLNVISVPGSVMHYGPYGFASDPYTPTIRTLERGQQSTIGQRSGPSFLDFQVINVAYGCSDHCPSIHCFHNGYPNPNNCLICACPDGLSGPFCEAVKPSSGACGGVLMAYKNPQYITSPNYPNHFNEGDECYWILRTVTGDRIFMDFVDDFEFLCEDTCDKSYVEVKYHNDKRLTGSRHCCSSLPDQRFISFDNEMLVLMKGSVGGYRGFRARFWSNTDEPNTEEATTQQPPNVETRRKTTKDIFPLSLEVVTEVTTESSVISSSVTKKLQLSTKQYQSTVPPKWERRYTTVTSLLSTIDFSSVPTTKHNLVTNSFSRTRLPYSTDAPMTLEECRCGDWSEWMGECSQRCGGCGHRTRIRECRNTDCRNEEKRLCNFGVCPTGTNFLINNGEFHILWRGCCVGLFRSGDKCAALETERNPFLQIISSLLNIHDSKGNITSIPRRISRGEH
ncbi:CUB domain protein [Dictyocaulus viviparus]|uniref:CUB domain protein n=1 Tax=Dictyocaulus viviparus TaxID=29172 RepID=A0A0D8XAZ9_DICVI|nr:CUB domain protein [Dictyocaulus viviparus]